MGIAYSRILLLVVPIVVMGAVDIEERETERRRKPFCAMCM